jgi:O-antigen/teichoic acid export membrane protein
MSSLKITYAILIPAIVLVYFAIEPLLSIIGSEYVHMVNFIRIMAFSAIFIANTFIYTSIIRITKKNWLLLLINAMLFTALIVSSYLLMLQFDLIGIAYSWLFSYLFINLVVLLLEAKGIIAYVRSYIK